MANAKTMKWVNITSAVLVALVALNAGLITLFKFDLLTTVLGTGQVVYWVYVLAGLSGAYALWRLFKKQ